jgi:hypothetical protein
VIDLADTHCMDKRVGKARRQGAAAWIFVAVLVAFTLYSALTFLGDRVPMRLGGPCSFPEDGPLPSFCHQ